MTAARHCWLLLAVNLACADAAAPAPGHDRTALLRRLTEQVILPGYGRLETASGQLVVAAEQFCAVADAGTLAAVRERWREVRARWKETEAYNFGPVMRERIEANIESRPLRRASIEAALTDSATVTDAWIQELGAVAKGLPVLEYLLFPEDAAADAVLGSFRGSPRARRTCAYVMALSRDLKAQARRIVAVWGPDGEDFAGELIGAGGDSTVYMRQQHAIDAVLNEVIALVARMESEGLAKPLGLRDGGEPQPRAIDGYRSGSGVADLQDNLTSVSLVLRGGEREVQDSLLAVARSEDARIGALLHERLDLAEQALAAIPAPLAMAVVDNPGLVREAFTAVQGLLRLLSVDLAGKLGVTVTFSDNDGD